MPTYNRGKKIILDSTLSWTSDTIMALLVTDEYLFDADHNFVADITDELTDGSYARVELTAKASSEDDTGDIAILHADPVEFGALNNERPAALILYKEVTDDDDSPLITYHDDGFGAPANGTEYTVTWAGAGDEVIHLGDPA